MPCGCDPGARHICNVHDQALQSLKKAGVLEWVAEYAGVMPPREHKGLDILVAALSLEPLSGRKPLLPNPELGQDVAMIAHYIQTLRNKLRETAIRLRTAAAELENV